MIMRGLAGVALLACLLPAAARAAHTPAPAARRPLTDPLAAPHAALRELQFSRAIQLLNNLPGNADAQYLLGTMYLNGVGVAPDHERALTLLTFAANHGNGAAAYILAGEAARGTGTTDETRALLLRSAELGYVRANEALKKGGAVWTREVVGAADASLFTAWVIDCAQRNDSAELQRLGAKGAQVRDDFGRTALQHAAAAGSLASVEVLLQEGADTKAADSQGVTALMLAAELADAGVTTQLLQHGADPAQSDAEHRTATFYAARANRVEPLRALSQAGASLDARDSRGYNALDAALAVEANETAAQLRAGGMHSKVSVAARGDHRSGVIDAAHPGDVYRGWPALALAIARNDIQGATRLINEGADARLRTPQGDTLLQVAADARALTIIPLLLAHGADATEPDHSGHTPLWLAAVRWDLPLLQALLAAGVRADTHSAQEEAPLLTMTRAAHAAGALALVNAGADVNVIDAQKRTPLMIAAASGQRVVLEAFLAHHANLEAEDNHGRTALWYAAAGGSAPEAALLLSSGAKISAVDAAGLAPLHAAAAQPSARILQTLIDAHAALNSRSAAGDSALILAAASGHADIVQLLLAQSAAIDLQNNAGDTALIAASRGGYAAVCKLLVDAGANKGLRNHAGVAAADVAASRGFSTLAASINGKG